MKKTYPSIQIEGKRISATLSLPDVPKLVSPRPKPPVVILVHGGPGGTKDGPSDLFIKMTEKLSDVGIASMRFDFLGAGESDGDYVDMTLAHQTAEYNRVLDQVKQEGFASIGLLGESLGAVPALSGLSKDIKALALLWPAIYLMDTSLTVYLADSAQEQLKSRGYILEDGVKVGRAFIEEFQRVDNVENHVRRIAVPTLMIHGDSDSEVPHQQTEKAFALLPEPKKKIIVPKGDHCLRKSKEQDLVVKEAVQWFSNYLSRAKSD